MTEAEKLVRETWKSCHAEHPIHDIWIAGVSRWFGTWQAAADFTRQRLKEIEEVEIEIENLVADVSVAMSVGDYRDEIPIYERTIHRLEAIRDQLKSGMKEQS